VDTREVAPGAKNDRIAEAGDLHAFANKTESDDDQAQAQHHPGEVMVGQQAVKAVFYVGWFGHTGTPASGRHWRLAGGEMRSPRLEYLSVERAAYSCQLGSLVATDGRAVPNVPPLPKDWR
jgi:hypothetical protein